MADGDVVVYYRLIPTTDSIKKAAEQIVGNINASIGKTAESIGKSFSGSSFGKGFSKTMEGMQKQFSKIPGVSAIGKGMAAGAEAGGGAGAGIGAMAGSLTALVGIGLVISAAIAIVSSFFEAVGPILKVLGKVLTAVILILLMPFLRVLLPYLPAIIKALLGTAQWLAGIFTIMLNVVGKWLQAIWDSIMKVGNKLGAAFEALGRGDIAGFFENVLGAGVELLIGALVFLAGPIMYGLGKAIMDNLPAIVTAITDLLVGVAQVLWGLINGIGLAVFGPETWEGIKNVVRFIRDRVFSEGGIWEKIKGAIDYIGTEVFGEGIWESIKTALGEATDSMIAKFVSIRDKLSEILTGLIDLYNNTLGRFLGRISTAPMSAMSSSGAVSPKDFLDLGSKISESLKKDLTPILQNPYVTTYTHGDFISRPGMGAQPFSPSDTIIGMKNPKGLGGSVTINNTFHIDSKSDKSDLRKILESLGRSQARELRSRTSYVGGFYA